MIDSRRLLAVALLSATLAGCAATAIPRVTPPPTTAPSPPITPPKPVQNNSLIGQNANAALGLFGKPRLDVTEGIGRKLQFAGDRLHPRHLSHAPQAGADPVVTHVDARAPDGRDASVTSCITALQQRYGRRHDASRQAPTAPRPPPSAIRRRPVAVNTGRKPVSPLLPAAIAALRTIRSRPIRLIGEPANTSRKLGIVEREQVGERRRGQLGARQEGAGWPRAASAKRFQGQTARQSSQP